MAKIQAHLVISGKVQGVFYRSTAQGEAKKLLLTGWIKNRPDGTVECVVEGEEVSVDKFIAWAKRGSKAANVKMVEITRGKFTDSFTSFTVQPM